MHATAKHVNAIIFEYEHVTYELVMYILQSCR